MNSSKTINEMTKPDPYAGQEMDEETARFNANGEMLSTGLMYYNARFYDPQLGRFLTPDSIVPDIYNPQDYNRYAYVRNNPIIYTDPTGHYPWEDEGEDDFDDEDFGTDKFDETSEIIEKLIEIDPTIEDQTLNLLSFFSGPVRATKSAWNLVFHLYDSIINLGSFSPPRDALPQNPDDLLQRGYIETSHPNAKAAGHRTFENPTTGDRIQFDQGEPGKPGHGGRDYYHQDNPLSTGPRDEYLDKYGDPCRNGCGPSHLYPGD